MDTFLYRVSADSAMIQFVVLHESPQSVHIGRWLKSREELEKVFSIIVHRISQQRHASTLAEEPTMYPSLLALVVDGQRSQIETGVLLWIIAP